MSGLKNEIDGYRLLKAKFERLIPGDLTINFLQSPKNSKALALHYDDTEIFALQLLGQKKWEFYDRVIPLANGTDYRPQKPHLTRQITTKQGDLLYIPRGLRHKACTGSSDSLHLGIAIKPLTIGNYVRNLIAKLEVEDPKVSFVANDFNLPLVEEVLNSIRCISKKKIGRNNDSDTEIDLRFDADSVVFCADKHRAKVIVDGFKMTLHGVSEEIPKDIKPLIDLIFTKEEFSFNDAKNVLRLNDEIILKILMGFVSRRVIQAKRVNRKP
ncbi:MAG: hypothetical protein HRU19_32015 [Pseudobacteriovorax sp.]|nr:hypothetical protein [Pseudobacteriovorax sp.]